MQKKEFIFPDFSNSNLNISSTIAEFLGVHNENPTIDLLKDELEKGYKNIVFICFDGMGMYPLEKNLNKGDLFLRENKKVLLSTFPSTTTNATTSLISNLLPSEHGWFGWSLYFKNLNKNIDIYLNADSWTGEKIDGSKINLVSPEKYFDKAQNSEYNINTVFPSYIKVSHNERNHIYKTENEFFRRIFEICEQGGKNFCYAYYPEPDSTMHKNGVSSEKAKNVILSLQKNVQDLVNRTEDTLFIITADHGQIDIEGYVEFYKDKKLLDMLKIYPYLDSRSPAFIVKDGEEQNFENYFNSKYSSDFELHKTSELIEKGVFGNKVMNSDFRISLGDYIAIGTYTHKQGLLTKKSERFKGHHTSLTEEMEVPLILIKSKR